MHSIYMQRALDIAKKGFVSPNPRVGAVLVKNDQIIAEGFHHTYGGSHAEINLFNSLPNEFDYSDTILYVSLEPCSHHGKTPPCTDTIIKKKIPKVIIACPDPNPLVSGKGIQKLQDAGIEVITGILKEEAEQLNEVFFSYITTSKPYVLVKSGVSLDGKICTVSGQSKWITSDESRLEVHYLRSTFTAIMVGINTVIEDDPLLSSRIPNGRNPIRIVIDSKLRTPLSSQLVQTSKDIKTIIVTSIDNESRFADYMKYGIEMLSAPMKNSKVDLNALMDILGKKNIDSILVEGGGELIFSAFECNIVNKLQLYIAPILIGGKNSKSFIGGAGVSGLQDAFQIKSYTIRNIGKDIVIEAYIK